MEIRVKVFHYDVFTTTPGKGNPAGVVLNSDALSTEQMQLIAARKQALRKRHLLVD
ncbi:PhzF family phenazine biosynthesis protein [Exiguobacterium sp. s138]|uniref:PhzF family phenazine biosynthesis protein n=1 Tax=Exiguobacterium sp. s138 TaxID=2751202 RepID=UPI002036675B|nr:PhzF family phenazine biosynthesis protein [Exiguobacterium sp. s138]